MYHGLQNLLVSIRHQAHGPENLQHCHFGLDILCPQALWDGVDALWVSQHVSTALRVVHQGLDTADDRRVDPALWRLVVHAAQEVEEAGEAIQFNEARNKPDGDKLENRARFSPSYQSAQRKMDQPSHIQFSQWNKQKFKDENFDQWVMALSCGRAEQSRPIYSSINSVQFSGWHDFFRDHECLKNLGAQQFNKYSVLTKVAACHQPKWHKWSGNHRKMAITDNTIQNKEWLRRGRTVSEDS